MLQQPELVNPNSNQELNNQELAVILERFIKSKDDLIPLATFHSKESDRDEQMLASFGLASLDEAVKLNNCLTDLRRVAVFWNTGEEEEEHVIVQRNVVEDTVTYSAIKVVMTEADLIKRFAPKDDEPVPEIDLTTIEAVNAINDYLQATEAAPGSVINIADSHDYSDNTVFDVLMARLINLLNISSKDYKVLYDRENEVSVYDLGQIQGKQCRLVGYRSSSDKDWLIRLEN